MSIKTDNYALYCEFYNELAIDENLAFFESHNSMDLAGNLLTLAKEISKYKKIVISCDINSKNKIETLINRYGILQCQTIYRESKDYFKTLASAKYLFTDVAFYSLFRKKTGQICITTWHGTPLKTLGFDFIEDSYVVANQKRGFLLSDYFICPNQYTWEAICKSYQLDGLFNGKVVYEGYPRNSVFFDSERREIIKKELSVGEKKIIVYMPTWRGRVVEVNGEEQSAILQKFLEKIDEVLPEGYEFLAKLHRLNQNALDFNGFEKVRIFPEGYETYDVLNVADILITDYSSVMFDFLSTKKKTILYCYDKEDYIENRTCYFDIDKLPFPIVTDIDALMKEILSPKQYDDKNIRDYFCCKDNIDSTKNIVKSIILGKGECDELCYKKNKTSKSLIYCGDLKESNATDALFEYIGKNTDNLYITYMNHLFKECGYKLLQFRDLNQVPIYMYQKMYSNYTTSEVKVIDTIKNKISKKIVVTKDEWKKQDEITAREFERYTYQNKFVKLIRFSGLDLESLKWFRVFEGEKIIYIHDDMLQKSEKNYEYKIYLEKAMEYANEIHYANRDILEKAKNIFGKFKARIFIDNLY